eukprot:TRINITY_DN20028_c0_g1_i2.p1 TRINITY_DN20028_c0_g1~~TRINITY_DN20028_c0_g1_i2.p1  ORF type:complete len:515 (-),score=75.36 TRINITY_DN20028_c0_g1_i2:83-1627(-)
MWEEEGEEEGEDSFFHFEEIPWRTAEELREFGGLLECQTIKDDPSSDSSFSHHSFCLKGFECRNRTNGRCKKRHPCEDLATEGKCKCSGLHMCKFPLNCRRLSDFGHMTSCLHVCPLGITCGWKDDPLHGYFFRHPCVNGALCDKHEEVVACRKSGAPSSTCSRAALEHEHRFLHPKEACIHGKDCVYLKYYKKKLDCGTGSFVCSNEERPSVVETLMHLCMYFHMCPLGASCGGLMSHIPLDVERKWHSGHFIHTVIDKHKPLCVGGFDWAPAKCDSREHRKMYYHICRDRFEVCVKKHGIGHFQEYLHEDFPTVDDEMFLEKPFGPVTERVLLAPTDPAYIFAFNRLNDDRTGAKCKGLQIFEIRNPALYSKFQRRCLTVRRESVGRAVNKKWLFHGGPPEAIENILLNGFNPKEGNIGCRYGSGVYTAVHAGYSYTSYARADSNGIRRMFLCEVCCGDEQHISTAVHKRATDINPRSTTGRRYDCATDGSTMYVVYQPHQAYGRFLYQYKL